MALPAAVERFATEGVLIAGGARAILLQIADPVVGAGVARHSDFANRPLDRLRNTLTFSYAVVLGTPEEARLVAGHVDRAHAGIPGATDPAHQLWVAATLYDTAVRVHDLVFGPLDEQTADNVLDAYSALGTALQVPRVDWPVDRAAFGGYWSANMAALEVGDDARRVAHDLFHPTTAPWWLRAALPLANLLTASLLDPPLREAYGMPWSVARARRARAAWRVIRAVVRVLPPRLRRWPARHTLARLRARTT